MKTKSKNILCFKGRFIQNQKPLMSLNHSLIDSPSKHILFPRESNVKSGYLLNIRLLFNG